MDSNSGFRESFRHEKNKALSSALAQIGIEPHCISLLKSLFADQKATVMTDKQSDVFEMKKGTKTR